MAEDDRVQKAGICGWSVECRWRRGRNKGEKWTKTSRVCEPRLIVHLIEDGDKNKSNIVEKQRRSLQDLGCENKRTKEGQ